MTICVICDRCEGTEDLDNPKDIHQVYYTENRHLCNACWQTYSDLPRTDKGYEVPSSTELTWSQFVRRASIAYNRAWRRNDPRVRRNGGVELEDMLGLLKQELLKDQTKSVETVSLAHEWKTWVT